MVTSVQHEASRPMVHQRQPDETTCWATVVAMLADIPVARLLAEIEEEFGMSYQEMIEKVGLTEVFSWVEGRFGLHLRTGRATMATDAYLEYLETLPKAAKLYALPSGRGAISLIFPEWWIKDEHGIPRFLTHAAAYSDGVVYDPGFSKPISLARFRHEYARARIKRVQVVT